MLQQTAFRLLVGGLSRPLAARDRLLSRVPRDRGDRVRIVSGANFLDAALVVPNGGSLHAAVLICHGIGETVEHWVAAQALLSQRGLASLVFNYSGFGRSSGDVDAQQCERDALAAWAWLRTQLPDVPTTLLGFSLGTGVACAVVSRCDACGLILCEGYPSFAEAAARLGAPRWLFGNLWQSAKTLESCTVPVLVVHGRQDRLFPVAMGEKLAEACGGQLAVIEGMGHPDLHATPRVDHWMVIVEWLHAVCSRDERTGVYPT